MSLLKDNGNLPFTNKSQSDSTIKSSGRDSHQIANLKRKVQRLESANQALKARVPQPVNVFLQGDNIVAEWHERQHGRDYVSTKSLDIPALQGLSRLVNPIMRIAKAATLGGELDAHTSRHEIDENGRQTKVIEKDENGKTVYQPNQLDRLRAVSDFLLSHDDTRNALNTIAKALEGLSKDALEKQAMALAQGGRYVKLADLTRDINLGPSDDVSPSLT